VTTHEVPSVSVWSRAVGPPWVDGIVNAQVAIARAIPEFEFHWFGLDGWVPDNPRFVVGGLVPDREWGYRRRLSFLRWALGQRTDLHHLIFHPRPGVMRALRPLLAGKIVVQTIQTAPHLSVDPGRVLVGSHLVAVSDRIRRLIEPHAGGRPITVIPPVVDVPRLRREVGLGPAREALPVPATGRYLLYAGNYSEALGVLDAVNLFVGLANDHPELHLVIANRPSLAISDEESVRRRVTELVATAGLDERTTVLGTTPVFRSILAHADALVFPASDLRGTKLDLPLVLLEAMALQVPIAVYALEPFAEMEVRHAGVDAAVGDVEALVAKLSLLLDGASAPLGTHGLDLVEARFSPATQASRLERVYRHALAGRS